MEALSSASQLNRRISSLTASVRPCMCHHAANQFLRRTANPGSTPAKAVGSRPTLKHAVGISSRRRLVIRASGPAGGLGGHGGGRGEPVSPRFLPLWRRWHQGWCSCILHGKTNHCNLLSMASQCCAIKPSLEVCCATGWQQHQQLLPPASSRR